MDRKRPRRPRASLNNAALRVGIAGAGRAGSALACALSGAGYAITAIASRTAGSAERLAARLPDCRAVAVSRISASCDLVLLTVPDDAIATVAGQIPWQVGQMAVHCAGSLGRDVLIAAERAGALTGSWHPLQSLAGGASNLAGSRFGIDADPPLRGVLEAMTTAIGAFPLLLPPDGRTIYHLGAAIVSNYAVALVALAADLWQSIGIDRAEAVAALAPLLAGTAANLSTTGLPGALTGPIARGDLRTIERHLSALAATRPDAVALYQALGREALALAAERGLPPERARALAAQLTPAHDATMAVAHGAHAQGGR